MKSFIAILYVTRVFSQAISQARELSLESRRIRNSKFISHRSFCSNSLSPNMHSIKLLRVAFARLNIIRKFNFEVILSVKPQLCLLLFLSLYVYRTARSILQFTVRYILYFKAQIMIRVKLKKKNSIYNFLYTVFI